MGFRIFAAAPLTANVQCKRVHDRAALFWRLCSQDSNSRNSTDYADGGYFLWENGRFFARFSKSPHKQEGMFRMSKAPAPPESHPSAESFRDSRWMHGLAPVAAMAAIVPWVARRIMVDIPPELHPAYGFWRLPDVYVEYKTSLILALGVLMGAGLVLRALSARECARGAPNKPLGPPPADAAGALDSWKSPEYWPLYALAAAVGISALLSPYTFTAWNGAPLRREGAFLLLAYLATVLFARRRIADPRAFRWFLWLLAGSSLLMAAAGLGQRGLGFTILNTSWGRALATSLASINTSLGHTVASTQAITPGIAASIELAPPSPPQPPIYSQSDAIATLYNTNYYGTYIAIALAAMAGGALVRWRSARWLQRAAIIAALAVMMAALAASRCLGAFFGLGAGCLATIALTHPIWRQWPRRVWRAAGAVVLSIAICGWVALAATPWGQALRRHAAGAIQAALHPVDPPGADGQPLFQALSLRLRDGRIEWETTRGRLEMTASGAAGLPAEIEIRDANRAHLPLIWSPPDSRGLAAGSLASPAYNGLSLARHNSGQFDVHFDDGLTERKSYTFALDSAGATFYHPTIVWRLDSTAPAAYWRPWPGFERLGSSRGYFWSRAIPLLPGAGLFGYGPDAVPHVFPQDDIPARRLAHMDEGYHIHKLHNWYLSTWLGTGIIGLIALLTFLAFHFIRLARAWVRWWRWPGRRQSRPAELPDAASLYAAAILAAWAGGWTYAGSVNWTDSTAHFSPVFWALAGMGWAAAARLIRITAPQAPLDAP